MVLTSRNVIRSVCFVAAAAAACLIFLSQRVCFSGARAQKKKKRGHICHMFNLLTQLKKKGVHRAAGAVCRRCLKKLKKKRATLAPRRTSLGNLKKKKRSRKNL